MLKVYNVQITDRFDAEIESKDFDKFSAAWAFAREKMNTTEEGLLYISLCYEDVVIYGRNLETGAECSFTSLNSLTLW